MRRRPSRRASWRTIPPPTPVGRVLAWTRTCCSTRCASGSPGDAYRGGRADRRGASRRAATRAHELLLRGGQQLRDIRVLVVGAAYKPGVADCAHSPAVEIIERLQAEGVQVDFHDPLVPVLQVGDESMHSIDPDPRRDASGSAPKTTSSLLWSASSRATTTAG